MPGSSTGLALMGRSQIRVAVLELALEPLDVLTDGPRWTPASAGSSLQPSLAIDGRARRAFNSWVSSLAMLAGRTRGEQRPCVDAVRLGRADHEVAHLPIRYLQLRRAQRPPASRARPSFQHDQLNRALPQLFKQGRSQIRRSRRSTPPLQRARLRGPDLALSRLERMIGIVLPCRSGLFRPQQLFGLITI